MMTPKFDQMTPQEALEMLRTTTHDGLTHDGEMTGDGAQTILRPFGIEYQTKKQNNYSATTIAGMISKHLGIDFPPMFWEGSLLETTCNTIEEKLT